MELEGHPTQDIVEELQRRGAITYKGSKGGPNTNDLEFARRADDQAPALWLMIPEQAFETGLDEAPPLE